MKNAKQVDRRTIEISADGRAPRLLLEAFSLKEVNDHIEISKVVSRSESELIFHVHVQATPNKMSSVAHRGKAIETVINFINNNS